MAENFFTGLTGAIQQNAKQRNNDDYIELMRQKQLQSEMSGALADRRADEEMVMRREAANRQQEESTRRIRALDFENNQREAQAKRAELVRTETADLASKYWGPQAVLGADGNPVMDKDGNPVTTKRDPKNLRDQFLFFEKVAAISHQHNGIDPKAYGQFLMDRKALEDAGKTQVFENALRNDREALTEVGGAVGLSGDVRIGTRVDKNGIPSMFFSGKGKDGKQTEVDALTAMSIFGGSAKDPIAGARAQAVQSKTIGISQQNADANTVSAQARMVSANHPPRGGGGSGGDSDGSGPLTGNALLRETKAYVDDNRADKPSFSKQFGAIPPESEDTFARDRMRVIGIDALHNGVPDGKGGRVWPRSAGEAQTMAGRLFDRVQNDVIAGTYFSKGKDGKWSQVPAGTAGAVPFNSAGVPFTLKQQARNDGVSARLGGKQ